MQSGMGCLLLHAVLIPSLGVGAAGLSVNALTQALLVSLVLARPLLSWGLYVLRVLLSFSRLNMLRCCVGRSCCAAQLTLSGTRRMADRHPAGTKHAGPGCYQANTLIVRIFCGLLRQSRTLGFSV